MAMHSTWIIARRELIAFFSSATAYVAVTAFLIIGGYLFFWQLFAAGEASMRAFFGLCPLLLVFLAPVLTMHLLAEEKRTRTFEMLISLPVSEWQIVLGKFIAALVVINVPLLLTLAYAVTISALGKLDWGAISGGYLGLGLLSASYVALGLLASSWTASQVVAASAAMALLLPCYLTDGLAVLVPSPTTPLLAKLGSQARFGSFARGIMDTRDVVYYLSLTAGALALAVVSLRARHRGRSG